MLSSPVAPQSQAPSLPLEEIVRQFAQQEDEYARAHTLYSYQLSVKIQEIGEDDQVLGEFEQTAEVDFDPSGRRRSRLLGNPRTDLAHLSVTRIELSDLEFVPLFIFGVEQIPDYDVAFLSKERLDEVATYLFRVTPRRPPRTGERLFEGLIWVDAEKLDVVRAHGRSKPPQTAGALKGLFQRLEIFREPVDGSLFPTYVRADDVLSVRDVPVRARLILRFSNHKRVREPEPADANGLKPLGQGPVHRPLAAALEHDGQRQP